MKLVCHRSSGYFNNAVSCYITHFNFDSHITLPASSFTFECKTCILNCDVMAWQPLFDDCRFECICIFQRTFYNQQSRYSYTSLSNWTGKKKFCLCNYLVIIFLCFFPYPRSWSVLNQISGGGQFGPCSGSEDSGSAACWWELGSKWCDSDVALREQPLTHHHCQICPVPGLHLSGEPGGRHPLMLLVWQLMLGN